MTIEFNFYHVLQFIIVLFAIIGGYSVIKDLIHAVSTTYSRCFKDKLDHKKDCELMQCLSKKDVKLVTLENAQEIHEINKRLDAIEFVLSKIKPNEVSQ